MLCLSLALAVVPVPVAAQVETNYYVSTTGNDTGDGSQDNPWLTIQHAVDTVSSGATINVAAGTYTENLTIAKKLTLQGEDRETTIIDGNETGTVVTITADDVAVSGFTIQNGSGNMAGGIYIEGSETGEISATVTDCTFKNNYGTSAGGIFTTYASLDVSGCTFDDNNTSDIVEGLGGALAHHYGSSLEVSGSTFSGNSGWDGGGILIKGGTEGHVTATISQSTFTNNKAYPGFGGAIVINNNVSALISNSTFSGNSAALGGAIWNSSNSDVEVHYSKFSGDTATYDGDEIYANEAIDATKNWWGQATGPADGQIWGSVITTPWYATATTTPETEKVTVMRGETVVAYSDTIQGAFDAVSAGDTIKRGTLEATIDLAQNVTPVSSTLVYGPTGSAIKQITVTGEGGTPVKVVAATYASNPGGPHGLQAQGYYDVHLSSISGVTQVTIKFAPALPNAVVYYWNEDDGEGEWLPCEPQEYSDSDGAVTVTIGATGTTPGLDYLTGGIFMSATPPLPPPPPPIGGEAFPISPWAANAPLIALCVALAAGAGVFVWRRARA